MFAERCLAVVKVYMPRLGCSLSVSLPLCPFESPPPPPPLSLSLCLSVCLAGWLAVCLFLPPSHL